MNIRKLLPRAVLAVILLVVPAAADAPRDPPQYDRFDFDSVTIKDLFTRLQWDRRNVIRATKNLAAAGCTSLLSLENAGRLPTVKELLTIVDEEPHREYEFGAEVDKLIDDLAFADTPVDLPYWTSTPAPGGKFWTIDFSTGTMEALADTSMGYARCVR